MKKTDGRRRGAKKVNEFPLEEGDFVLTEIAITGRRIVKGVQFTDEFGNVTSIFLPKNIKKIKLL